MKLHFLLYVLLFGLVGCHVKSYQPYSLTNNKYKAQYAEFLAPGEQAVNSWYHYVTSVDKNRTYTVRTFFPELRQMTSRVSFASKALKVRQGPAHYWYDDGSRRSEGQFDKDKRSGTWSYYHYGGGISSRGDYLNNLSDGLWTYYDNKGRKTSEFTYRMGLREGKFVKYDSLANIINEGIYRADTLYQQSTERDNSKIVEEMPYMRVCMDRTDKTERMECSNRAMLEYIYRNIRYPETARRNEVEGEALIRFVVEKDGSVTDIVVMSGLCQSIADECRRIVEKMPPWEAGLQNGEKVRVLFKLPVRFKLE